MSSSITQIFDTIQSDVLMPFYYGLVSLVAIIALIFLVIQLIKGATATEHAGRSTAITSAIVILVICIVLGFAPGIVNWFISLAGGSVPGVSA